MLDSLQTRHRWLPVKPFQSSASRKHSRLQNQLNKGREVQTSLTLTKTISHKQDQKRPGRGVCQQSDAIINDTEDHFYF